MNDLFLMLGLESWKPGVTALLLPPFPFLVMMLAGAHQMRRHRWVGRVLVLTSVVLAYLCCTAYAAEKLTGWLLAPPPALSAQQIEALKRTGRDAPKTVIVVLGGGREAYAPEYGTSNLSPLSIERLRYGIWLGRETGLPVAFSGGISPGSPPGATEAEIATRIAAREFGRPLAWTEGNSRNTAENASGSVSIARREGITRIVLVTHAQHMPRARRAFERARAGMGVTLEVVSAPIATHERLEPRTASDFLPTTRGIAETRYAVREWLGLLAGA